MFNGEAAAHSEGGGCRQEQHARRVEGQQGQVALDQHGENGRKEQDGQRVASDVQAALAETGRQQGVEAEQQAGGQIGDEDSGQRAARQVFGHGAQ